MKSLTELIPLARAGDREARDELFAAAYPELKKLAHSRLRDGGRNTFLETTALVHESYLRFLNSSQLRLEDRRAFFAYASRVMRSVIIDAVREQNAVDRGGDATQVTLSTDVVANLPADGSEILRLHHALLALEEAEPRLAKVAEMRYFGGYSDAEIAETMGLAERTVRREWEKARLLMLQILQEA